MCPHAPPEIPLPPLHLRTEKQSVKDYLAEKGYTLKNSYAWNGYASDPEIWDPLAAWTNTVSEPLCMTVDGLIRYDMENVLQPGLATSWEHSEDGLTWTFHLREGVQWVDSQGRKLVFPKLMVFK